MKIKVKYWDKSLPKLKLPRKKDVGIDVYCAETVVVQPWDVILVSIGVSLQPPDGYWFQVEDRSSVSKYLHTMAGILDTSYIGPIKVRFLCLTHYQINKGDKIAQLILREDLLINDEFDLEEVDELEETSRGSSGFGSTGR